METAYQILTGIVIILFAGYIASSVTTLMRSFDKSKSFKWYFIFSIGLAIISIPRAILAAQLVKEYVFVYWGLTLLFIFNAILGYSYYMAEIKKWTSKVIDWKDAILASFFSVNKLLFLYDILLSI